MMKKAGNEPVISPEMMTYDRVYTKKGAGVVNAAQTLPAMTGGRLGRPARRVNAYYKNTARDFKRLCGKRLTINVKEGEAPRNAAILSAVMLHSGGVLSVVNDFTYDDSKCQQTVRTADNWLLKSGRQLRLNDLFKNKRRLKPKLTAAVMTQMNVDGKYRRNAVKRRVRQSIDVNQYYLTDDALHLLLNGTRDFALAYERLPAMAYNFKKEA